MDRMSQQGHYFHSESMHFASTNICLRNICPVVTSSGNETILDCHYILDAHDIYLGQQFQPAAPLCPDQQLSSYNNDDHDLAWHLSLTILPYVQAHSANGSSSENARIGPQRYHDTTGRRSGHRFPHPPPQYHSFHQHAQEIRGHSFNFHPPVTAPLYRIPTNPSGSSSILIHDAIEIGARHPGHVPFVGARIHHSHRGNMQEATLRHQNHPPATVFLDDDVALLVDHHTDMRLDPEDVSYEELLALGERIGYEKSGLSENIITSQMKTKTYLRSTNATNLEEAASEEQEADLCIICQDEYKNQEKIGILQCGHEYHTDCLKKWLLEKNVCPMCKSVALTPGEKCV